MREIAKNIVLLFVTVFVCVYLTEYLLGFYLVKSLVHMPLPPHTIQEHITVDYKVTYHYNNYSLRGPDFVPDQLYDIVLLGDSFFFGQGIKEGKTLSDRVVEKGYQVLNASEIATNPIDYYHKLRVLYSHGLKTKNVVVGLCMGNDFQDIGDRQIEDALAYSYRREFLKYDSLSFFKIERLRYQLRKKWITLCDYLRKNNNQFTETAVVHDFEHRKRFHEEWIHFFMDNKPEAVRTMQGYDQPPISAVRLTENEYLDKTQLNPDSIRNTSKILNRIYEVSKPRCVYIILIPDPYYVFGFRSSGYERFLHDFIKALDPAIKVIDLHGLTSPDMHYIHDGHWNERGHRFVTDVISRDVLSHNQ